ncbi:MAG TPA: hypothetical protein VGF69_23440 [Thermoanaerobaculia bacterium]|jgi:hypothetical protein
MRNAFVLICLTVVGADLCQAQTQRNQREWRQHFTIEYPPAKLAYRITKITEMPVESLTRELYLVEDGNGDRLLLTHVYDLAEQTVVYEVLDLETKEVVRATTHYPYKSATLRDTLDEARKAAPIPNEQLDVTLELNGVLSTAKQSEWASGAARDARSSLRRAASSRFLERLERLRPISGSRGELTLFCFSLLQLVLYEKECADSGGPLQPAAPDCSFDAEFPYPCSDQQKQKIATAKAAGKELAGMLY